MYTTLHLHTWKTFHYDVYSSSVIQTQNFIQRQSLPCHSDATTMAMKQNKDDKNNNNNKVFCSFKLFGASYEKILFWFNLRFLSIYLLFNGAFQKSELILCEFKGHSKLLTTKHLFLPLCLLMRFPPIYVLHPTICYVISTLFLHLLIFLFI